MEIITINGGFHVPKDDCLGKWQIEEQRLDHDYFTVPLACKYIPLGGVVLDIGAFNGDHTIAYSRAVGPDGYVMAIEPGKLAYECLCHNASLFPSKIRTMRLALSDVSSGSVVHAIDELNLGASRCVPVNFDLDAVPVTTVDWLMGQEHLPRLDFIKMDCEGFEVKVLIGAKYTIDKFKPVMLIEVNPSALQAQGATPIDIMRSVKAHGYSIDIIQPECNWSSPQFDVLCLPKPI